jgi:hypothetical protein
MNLFYKIHLHAFNVISIVLYHSGPTFGKVLYSCLDAFVFDASDYSGNLITHLLNASEAFPSEWFLQFWEQVKAWWAEPTRLRPTNPAIIDQIHELILEDRRISVKSIAEQLGISRERVEPIIHEDSDMIVACFLPCRANDLSAPLYFSQGLIPLMLCVPQVQFPVKREYVNGRACPLCWRGSSS